MPACGMTYEHTVPECTVPEYVSNQGHSYETEDITYIVVPDVGGSSPGSWSRVQGPSSPLVCLGAYDALLVAPQRISAHITTLHVGDEQPS
jgi:hypothetical protein